MFSVCLSIKRKSPVLHMKVGLFTVDTVDYIIRVTPTRVQIYNRERFKNWGHGVGHFLGLSSKAISSHYVTFRIPAVLKQHHKGLNVRTSWPRLQSFQPLSCVLCLHLWGTTKLMCFYNLIIKKTFLTHLCTNPKDFPKPVVNLIGKSAYLTFVNWKFNENSLDTTGKR